MTLQEILPAVRQLPPTEKVELLRLLEQENAANEDEHAYFLHTPLDCYGAAGPMMQELERFKAANPL